MLGSDIPHLRSHPGGLSRRLDDRTSKVRRSDAAFRPAFVALLALLACKSELNIISLIGIILLIGIVKKNAILMIDFALQAEREQGLPPVEAIYQACLLRFRPIMMTTMAALFGGLPLAIGMGVGSELRQPLGIAIVGGLVVSQLLTLYITPVYYVYIEGARLWLSHRHERRSRPDVKAAALQHTEA